MLIYHKTNGKLVTTQVMHTRGTTDIFHCSHVWEKHRTEVEKLEDNGDVFVTGATFVGAVYDGFLADRERFSHYIQEK